MPYKIFRIVPGIGSKKKKKMKETADSKRPPYFFTSTHQVFRLDSQFCMQADTIYAVLNTVFSRITEMIIFLRIFPVDPPFCYRLLIRKVSQAGLMSRVDGSGRTCTCGLRAATALC